MYVTDNYYSKNANGKVIVWAARVFDDGTTHISTGQIDGKVRQIRNENVVPKGKLTKYEQAVKEIKAKEKLKQDKGYKTQLQLDIAAENVDELHFKLNQVLTVNKTDSNDILKPMKAKPFVAGKCKYPMICQPKINGFRTTAILINDNAFNNDMFASNDPVIKLLTKEGHEYVIPRIASTMDNLFNNFNLDSSTVFDGELYVHNEILSNINRRLQKRKKYNDTISKNSLSDDPVMFCIFDLSIPDMSQLERLNLKDELLLQCGEIYYHDFNKKYMFNTVYSKYPRIINVRANIVNSDEEARALRDAALASGFEGVILRDMDAEYMFGGRRNNMFKYKGLKHSEFKVLDVIKKNEDNVRTYVSFLCRNDMNDKTFEVTAQGTEEDRQEYLNHPEDYIGKMVTLGFGERTVNSIPLHIKTVDFRNTYDYDINNLNIEI